MVDTWQELLEESKNAVEARDEHTRIFSQHAIYHRCSDCICIYFGQDCSPALVYLRAACFVHWETILSES